MSDTLKKNDYTKIDWLVLASVLFLLVLGAAIVFSASSYRAAQLTGNSAYYFQNHLIRIIVGVVLMVALMFVDYRKWLDWSPILYLCAVIMLFLLFTHSSIVISKNEAARWLRLGPFTFQPSDFARYVLVFVLARFLVQNREYLQSWEGFLKHMGLVILIVGMVALEKDLGTSIMIAMIAFAMLFLAEVKFMHLLSVGLTVVTLGLMYLMRNPYMLKRLEDFINLSMNNNMGSYQLQQSINSFKFGGIFGRGIGNSIQKYEFLPEAHKDFVFAVIGEELGIVGAVLVMALFVLLVHRGFKIAKSAPDEFGRLLAGGITICIGLYAFLNAAVTLAMVPTTGIPMPFISYGGSAMVTHLAAIGILINISTQSRKSYMKYPSRSIYRDRMNRMATTQSGPRPKKRRTVKRKPVKYYKVGQ